MGALFFELGHALSCTFVLAIGTELFLLKERGHGFFITFTIFIC
jgi:hypothetical protein